MRNPGERLAPAVWVLAAVKLLAHLLTTGRFGYEYFVDELYFNACAKHLAWGYVDMPPLHPAMTAVVTAIAPGSLFAIRLLPALAGAALVLLTGVLARDLGGGRSAQVLSAIGVAVAPIFLAIHSLSTMNAWEPLFWTGCAILLVRLFDGADPRLWLAFGLIAGVGLLNKHTMGLFGAGVAVGLVATARGREILKVRWVWIGAAAALFAFLPNLAWNIREGFPFFELQEAIRQNRRNVELSPLAFLGQQVEFLLPLSAPLWIGGLGWLLFVREGRRHRVLAIVYLVVLGTLLAKHGRVYYLAPAYPMLFAAGGVAAERLLGSRRVAWLRPAYAGLLAAAGIFLAPSPSRACRPRRTCVTRGRSGWSCRASKLTEWDRCRSFSPTGSVGRRWRARQLKSSTPCLRRSRRTPGFSDRITARPAPSTCMARVSGFRRLSPGTSRTTRGGRRPRTRRS